MRIQIYQLIICMRHTENHKHTDDERLAKTHTSHASHMTHPGIPRKTASVWASLRWFPCSSAAQATSTDTDGENMSSEHHKIILCVCCNEPWHIGCKRDLTRPTPDAQAPAERATSTQTSLRDPYGTSRTGLTRLQCTLQRNRDLVLSWTEMCQNIRYYSYCYH